MKTLNERDQQVLAFFEEAHTMEEFAEAHNLHYTTARNYVIPLCEQSLIRQLPFRRGKKIVYQTLWTTDGKVRSEIHFRWKKENYTATSILALLVRNEEPKYWRIHQPLHRFGLALANVWWARLCEHDPEYSKTAVSVAESHKYAIEMRNQVEENLKLLDQLLASPLWKAKNTHELIKVKDHAMLQQLVNQFHTLYIREKK